MGPQQKLEGESRCRKVTALPTTSLGNMIRKVFVNE
jgi:hypothetical protein